MAINTSQTLFDIHDLALPAYQQIQDVIDPNYKIIRILKMKEWMLEIEKVSQFAKFSDSLSEDSSDKISDKDFTP